MGYTPKVLLTKVRKCMAWDSDYVNFDYSIFKIIMMGNEDFTPVMTYERTVKEKYALLQALGYISKSGMLNVERAKECIGEY